MFLLLSKDTKEMLDSDKL